jgi:hypothetical protein
VGKIRRNLYVENVWYVKQVASNLPIQREGEREKNRRNKTKGEKNEGIGRYAVVDCKHLVV